MYFRYWSLRPSLPMVVLVVGLMTLPKQPLKQQLPQPRKEVKNVYWMPTLPPCGKWVVRIVMMKG